MAEKFQRASRTKPDETAPGGWLQIHRDHGGRPFFEVKIGNYHVWRCTCGHKFRFTDEDRERAPNDYVLGER